MRTLRVLKFTPITSILTHTSGEPKAPTCTGRPVLQNFLAISNWGRPRPVRLTNMSWFYLLFAGLFEVIWAVGLKYTEGFTRLWPSLATLTAIIISMSLLGLSLKELPISTAYAIWTGIGVVGTVILGIFLFGENVSALRLVCIALILTGIVGLKLS